MKRPLALFPIAVAAVALATTPALAKSKKHRHHPAPYAQSYGQPYVYGYQPAPRWTSRVASDPSFGNRAGINYARGTGRCVADLGYGRYEYCGW
jgi:hypothetical protein